ncbi:hypothetical protein [Shigella sonnei]
MGVGLNTILRHLFCFYQLSLLFSY